MGPHEQRPTVRPVKQPSADESNVADTEEEQMAQAAIDETAKQDLEESIRVNDEVKPQGAQADLCNAVLTGLLKVSGVVN